MHRGYELLGDANAGNRCGHCELSASRDSTPPRSSASCAPPASVTAPRAGWVRTSPHFYISPDDIDRLLAELP